MSSSGFAVRVQDAMVTGTYTMHALQAASGVPARTLRQWVRHKLLPKPLGRGRGARYDERHLVRARVVLHLRSKKLSLRDIHAQIATLSEPQLAALLPPPPRPLTAEGLPVPPPAPTYPAVTWEVVPLMDGLLLMVNPSRGAGLRRVADDIYRHYSMAITGEAGSPRSPA